VLHNAFSPVSVGSRLSRKVDFQWIFYGYRLGEVPLPHPGKPDPKLAEDDERQPGVKPGTVVWQTGTYDPRRRPALGVSIGCHVVGAKDPHACQDHLPTIVAGTAKRAATKVLPRNRQTVKRFKRFVAKYIRKNFVPLRPDTDVSCKGWLPKTKFTLARKEELQKLNDEIKDPFAFAHTLVKAFIKAESYGEYKHSRGIYSTSDEFKTIFGPYIKCIEEVLYDNPAYIKKVPFRDRPKALLEIDQEGATKIETDWTSMESHFDEELYECCEFALYRYMCSALPSYNVLDYCLSVIKGKRHIRFKHLLMEIEATRLSGEMSTSCGNTFTNHMIMLFVAEESGIKSMKGLYEGDDGATTYYGQLREQTFDELGARLKIVKYDDLCEMSFCGMIFDRLDMRNVTDPIEVLVNFGWLGRRYVCSTMKRKLEILRCKGLSMHYQYPGCPIITALSQYALRVTRNITVRPEKIYMDQWNREQLLESLEWIAQNGIKPEEVGIRTRLLVEKKFGINLEDQHLIEAYLNSKNDISPIDIPCLFKYIKPASGHFYENYVRYVDVQGSDRDYPILMADAFTEYNAIAWCDSQPGTRGYMRQRQTRTRPTFGNL
jgi:hypothetical protein